MYTHYDIISIPLSSEGAPALVARLAAAIADNWQPLGAAFADGQGNLCQTIVKGSIVGTFEDLTSRVDDLETFQGTTETALSAQTTRNAAVDAWALALATKLNADAGVTDTNYDTTI